MLNLRHFRQVWELTQEDDYAISIDLKDAYLHIPFVKHQHIIFAFFHQINLTNGRFRHLGWLQFLGVILLLLNPHCFFASAQIFFFVLLCTAVLALFCLGLPRGIESHVYLIILKCTMIHNTCLQGL